MPTKTTPLFAGSRAKLQRAERFIAELATTLQAYNRDEPVSARFELVDGTLQIRITWKAIAVEAQAILGDAVHNLRAALDLMACELARLNGQSDKDVYFPFAKSPEQFAKALRSSSFGKAGPDAVELLKQFAPYAGGNERLRAIHDLDIEDKHRELLDTEKRLDIQLSGYYDINDLTRNHVSVDATNTKHYFQPDGPLAGLPLIETLEELVELVNGILIAFLRLVEVRSAAR